MTKPTVVHLDDGNEDWLSLKKNKKGEPKDKNGKPKDKKADLLTLRVAATYRQKRAFDEVSTLRALESEVDLFARVPANVSQAVQVAVANPKPATGDQHRSWELASDYARSVERSSKSLAAKLRGLLVGMLQSRPDLNSAEAGVARKFNAYLFRVQKPGYPIEVEHVLHVHADRVNAFRKTIQFARELLVSA